MEHALNDHGLISWPCTSSSGDVLLKCQPCSPGLARVTERQVEVLCLLAEGMTSNDVAERMKISHHTVTRHVVNMMTALGAANRLELLARAFVGGVVALDQWPPRPTGSFIVRLPSRAAVPPPAAPAQTCRPTRHAAAG